MQHPYLPPQQCAEYQVELGGKIRLAGGRGRGIGADNKQATSREEIQITAGYMSEPAAHLIPGHRVAHGPAHHESDPGRLVAVTPDQIERFSLPTAPQKTTDVRGERMDDTVQAEALPPDVLAAELTAAIEDTVDWDALDAARERGDRERDEIETVLQGLIGGES